MAKIKNEKELIETLKQDIDATDKNTIIMFSGHFPIVYKKEGAIEDFDIWGPFSKYSLKLACELGKYAKDQGKQVKFVFFADDHIYEEKSEINNQQIKTRRKNLYQRRSGLDAELPKEYRETLKKYGFNESDVIRHDHGKSGREDCLYFSEKILRATGRKISNDCAREYMEFIDAPRYFNRKENYLISFIPNRCQDNICTFALQEHTKGLSASHVFMETMNPNQTEKKLYTVGRGVTYRKDN